MSKISKVVEDHILSVGGYWPPSYGLLRLYEEITEYGEAIASQDNNNLFEEATDVLVITTCLANQYCLGGAIEVEPSVEKIDSREAHSKLLSLASDLSRRIMEIEGIKKPKETEETPPPSVIIAEISRICSTVLHGLGQTAEGAVEKVVEKKTQRDAKRFAPRYDPALCRSVLEFRKIQSQTHCPYARKAKIWGADSWDEKFSDEENNAIISRDLAHFCAVQRHVELDGFVVHAPVALGAGMPTLKRWFRGLIAALGRYEGRDATAGITEENWQFTFCDTRLFIAVFGSCYAANHPRQVYDADGTFVFFQPEASFDREKKRQGKKLDLHVGDRFKAAGYQYFDEIMEGRLEAIRYLKPQFGREPVNWWLDE
jgi:NTP pyrophosphatase (non-canonical NTP hydrolase)